MHHYELLRPHFFITIYVFINRFFKSMHNGNSFILWGLNASLDLFYCHCIEYEKALVISQKRSCCVMLNKLQCLLATPIGGLVNVGSVVCSTMHINVIVWNEKGKIMVYITLIKVPLKHKYSSCEWKYFDCRYTGLLKWISPLGCACFWSFKSASYHAKIRK